MLAATQISHQLLRQRIEVIAFAVIISVLIFELIRRRHLMERYALLWLAAGVTVLILALWKGLLTTLSRAAGISYGPSALFAVAFVFVLVMLVQFSMTVSRLSDQNTMLAQRLALLQQRVDEGPGDADGVGAEDDPAQQGARGGEPPNDQATAAG